MLWTATFSLYTVYICGNVMMHIIVLLYSDTVFSFINKLMFAWFYI